MDHSRTLFGTAIFFGIANLMTDHIVRLLPGGTFSTMSFWFLKKQPPGTAPKNNCSETINKLKKTHAKELFFITDTDLHPTSQQNKISLQKVFLGVFQNSKTFYKMEINPRR